MAADGRQLAEWVWCRDMRHSWEPHTVEDATVGSRRGYRQTVRCGRCGALRSRLLDHRGHVIGGASYTYPAGYLSPPGSGRMTEDQRAALRLSNLLFPSGASAGSRLRMAR